MAYWNDFDESIIQNSATAKLTPGIIVKFVIHNLIVDGKSQVHLLVKWFLPMRTQFRKYCGDPVEAWNKDVCSVFWSVCIYAHTETFMQICSS